MARNTSSADLSKSSLLPLPNHSDWTVHPTSHCQYSITSLALLDVLEKCVLVDQAAELDEMNGRTLTVDSDPKKTKSPAVKALKFLASSHLAQKPLHCTMQKQKQTEPHCPCDTWPLSSPCWLVAWKSLDSSFHSAQEEAPSSEDGGSSSVHGPTPDRPVPLRWAEPGLHQGICRASPACNLRPWVNTRWYKRTCGGWARWGGHYNPQCVQDSRWLWSCSELIPPWVDTVTKPGCHSPCRVAVIKVCLCVCSYCHWWTLLLQQTLTLIFYFSFFLRRERSVVFPWVCFWYWFLIQIFQPFIALDPDFKSYMCSLYPHTHYQD